jgi:hypothetical protein
MTSFFHTAKRSEINGSPHSSKASMNAGKIESDFAGNIKIKDTGTKNDAVVVPTDENAQSSYYSRMDISGKKTGMMHDGAE